MEIIRAKIDALARKFFENNVRFGIVDIDEDEMRPMTEQEIQRARIKEG